MPEWKQITFELSGYLPLVEEQFLIFFLFTYGKSHLNLHSFLLLLHK